jgi:uncharacterized protein (DUF697 family)
MLGLTVKLTKNEVPARGLMLKRQSLMLICLLLELDSSARINPYHAFFMTENQEKKCHAIIHMHAVAAAAGNAIPVPGLGVATDIVSMTSMAMSLCAVFGGSITQEAAKVLAIASLKNTMLKQPIKVLSKELSKFIPFLGQVVAPGISVVMIEAAGWTLAKELELKAQPVTTSD